MKRAYILIQVRGGSVITVSLFHVEWRKQRIDIAVLSPR